MTVLGLSCFYHDAAACLMRDGVMVAAAEEERFSRRKHDDRFPANAVAYCLSEAGISADDVDHVVFYEKPLLKFERILSSQIDGFPTSRDAFTHAMKVWLKQKLWTRSAIRRAVGRRATILFGEHHLSHAASAFLVSPFDEAAVLTADAVGEWTTTSVGIGHGTSLELRREIRFPHSLGLLYSAFTAYLGFEVNEGEYKVMGMAAYGRARYADKVRSLVEIADDGSFQLDLRYFEHHRSLRAVGGRFVELFGPRRRPGDEFDQRHADIAASIQHVLEEILVRIATDLRRSTGMTKLCMAGGVALNGLANTRVLNEAGFDEVFIQPAAGDSGGAIGAAAFVSHTILGLPRRSVMAHAYLGPAYTDADVRSVLDAHGAAFRQLSDHELVETVADLLAQGRVVGWSRGRMEFGPRALGSRSILASPCSARMKDVLNTKIKHREPFRPFGPSVTAEDAASYFDLRCASPYMLHIAPVREEKRALIPAVTHVDGTARIQTVEREINPVYYDLLRAFERRQGVPVLVNTSFNVRGEPIVCTPADAYDCFLRTEIDALVLGNFLVTSAEKRGERRSDRIGPVQRPEVIV